MKKQKKKQLKIKEKEECENMFLSLATSKKEIEFFYNLATKRYSAKKKRHYVIVEHDDGNVILYPCFFFSQITPDNINKILFKIKNESYKKIVIPCGEIAKETLSFIKNFDKEIVILDKVDTYKKLYTEYDFFPEITMIYKKDKKATIKELLALSFNRSKTKSYIFSSFILLFSSLFVRINIYYCVVASLLVLFAIISFINPFYKTKTNSLEL